MSKKISIWFATVLVVVASVITFQLTVIFSSANTTNVKDRFGVTTKQDETTAQDAPIVIPDETGGSSGEGAVTPDEPTDEKRVYTADEIRAAVNRKLSTILAYYDRYYIGELELEAILDGVAEGFVAYSGDKYGQYHDAEEYSAVMGGYSGEFAGLGVHILENPIYGAIEIINVMPDGPAYEAGLLTNDLIIAVDGVTVWEIGYDEAINRVKGAEGTEVTLTIARGENYETQFDVTVVRRKVNEQSITYEEIELDSVAKPVAYIRILDFNAKTPEQFKEAVGEGRSNNVHGFIFDLRNNGGGTLSSVVDMLDYILPEGPIVRIKYGDGSEQVYTSDAYNFLSEPVVVIVNRNTASAAELFTSSLRDYGKATPIIGETTYGKGTVQRIYPLGDGSALRLSISMYYPPFSDNFEGVGIEPDIKVSLADEFKYTNLFKLDHANDAQLQAALRVFQ